MSEEDIYPDKPSYEELENKKPPIEEMAQNTERAKEWYNDAPYVAARLIIKVAKEHEEFKNHILESDEFGSAHEMHKYNEEMHQKLNTMSLSAFQGGTAENMATSYLQEQE